MLLNATKNINGSEDDENKDKIENGIIDESQNITEDLKDKKKDEIL